MGQAKSARDWSRTLISLASAVILNLTQGLPKGDANLIHFHNYIIGAPGNLVDNHIQALYTQIIVKVGCAYCKEMYKTRSIFMPFL